MSRQARCGDPLAYDGTDYVCDRIDAHRGPHSAERWVHNDDVRRRHPRRFWLKVQWVDLPSTVPDHLPDNDESRGHGSVR